MILRSERFFHPITWSVWDFDRSFLLIFLNASVLSFLCKWEVRGLLFSFSLLHVWVWTNAKGGGGINKEKRQGRIIRGKEDCGNMQKTQVKGSRSLGKDDCVGEEARLVNSLYHPQAWELCPLSWELCSSLHNTHGGFPTVILKFTNLVWEQWHGTTCFCLQSPRPNLFHWKETPLPFSHRKHHWALGKPVSVSSILSTRNKEKVHDILWAPARTRRRLRKSPYPIWRLVEGACVMTELDWGDGMACWITTLVSWLGIRVLPRWWVPGPDMAPPTVLCIEIFCPDKTEGEDRISQCFILLSSSQEAKIGTRVMLTKYRVMASGKPWIHSSYNL